jgi:hypothetical protein
MDEFLSPHARKILLGDRRCTATNRSGERCGRASALGQFVCDAHGAKAPMSIKAGRERLLAMVEPAFDALLRALSHGPACELCGRTDDDKNPTVVAAAKAVLDRCGFGPHATLDVSSTDRPLEDVSSEELVARLEGLLVSARRLRDEEAGSTDAFAEGEVLDVTEPMAAISEVPATSAPEGDDRG